MLTDVGESSFARNRPYLPALVITATMVPGTTSTEVARVAGRPANVRELDRVPPRAERIEVLDGDLSGRDPDIVKLGSDVAEQAGNVSRLDRGGAGAVGAVELEMQVDFAAELAHLRERARFVRLAIHEGVERPVVGENRCVGVERARHCVDNGLAKRSGRARWNETDVLGSADTKY